MATLYELTAAQSAIEYALYENGGELTPELEAQLAETREALPAKIDGYNHILQGWREWRPPPMPRLRGYRH